MQPGRAVTVEVTPSYHTRSSSACTLLLRLGQRADALRVTLQRGRRPADHEGAIVIAGTGEEESPMKAKRSGVIHRPDDSRARHGHFLHWLASSCGDFG
jgi:hypothetical protein